MKTIITVIAIFSASATYAQMAISKTKLPNASVSLDFASYEHKGMILPYVEDKSRIVEPGTLIFDAQDKKVKYLKGTSWFDLTVDEEGVVDLSIQTNKSEVVGAKVSVGNPTAVDGVLVLEDNNQAMILPGVENPHLNIINPSPGMMVYDTVNKLLAVYNGTVWTFWAANED